MTISNSLNETQKIASFHELEFEVGQLRGVSEESHHENIDKREHSYTIR